MSFVAPIVIASFFGYIFGGVTQDSPPSKIAVAIVNQDDSEISRKVVAALAADAALDVKAPELSTEARETGARRQDDGGGGDSRRASRNGPEARSSAAATSRRSNCSTTLRTLPKCRWYAAS